MGWFYRKSAKFGPFRLNFSKSGIGVSAGIRGARVSTGPKGTYVNLGRGGVYYRQKIGGGYSAASTSHGFSSSGNANSQYATSLPANLNYPTFPQHGLPRIVTTLGLLCIPAIILLWFVFVIGIATNSNSSAGSNSNTRSLANTSESPSVQTSRERGFQAGFNYALRSQDTDKGGRLNQRRLKKLAVQLAAKEHEDKEWQSGWIEGYTKAFETTLANVNDSGLLRNQSSTQQLVPTTVPVVTRSESNGYIRGPRGGCYYLSGSGRKVYVDRGLCN
jgi:hypothetical protein